MSDADTEDHFVKVDADGRAKGTVFHFAECRWAAEIEPAERYVLTGDEERLLGLTPCKACYRLTHAPDVDEALCTLRKAVELSMTEYRQGKCESAERRLKDVEAWIKGDAPRPAL